jgi:hypothetical protein
LPLLHERFPEAVMLAERLHRASPKKSERMSQREISAVLAKAGHVMSSKYRKATAPRPFNPATIKAMVEGPMPAPPSGPRNLHRPDLHRLPAER